MSAIINYKCSNPACSLNVRIYVNFPIWSDDAPMGIRKVPVGLYNEKYVLGYTSQEACLSCKKIVDIPRVKKQEHRPHHWWHTKNKDTKIQQEKECSNCHTKDNFLEEGKLCTKCESGIVEVNNDFNVRF